MSEADVRQLVQNYIDGTFTANVELLQSCFHKDAIMTGYMGPDLVIATPAIFIEDIKSNPSMESKGDPYKADITELAVTGNVARATVKETGFFGEGALEDSFHILKDTDGKWKIISKCFTTL